MAGTQLPVKVSWNRAAMAVDTNPKSPASIGYVVVILMICYLVLPLNES
jgi:hypothetical protein